MADEPVTPSGWLPPAAPGSGPRPRFDVPAAPGPAPDPPPRAAPPTAANPQAVWALALGIGGLLLLMVSLGTLFLITLPCSAAAWVLALRARGQVELGHSTLGEGQATAALWIARIGVVAGIAAGIVLIALLASGFDFDRFRDDLQRELEQRRERRTSGVRSAVEGLRAVIGR